MTDTLRSRLIAMSYVEAERQLASIDACRDVALAAARMALTDYAERMDRAGQPAAAFGAVALAAGLDR